MSNKSFAIGPDTFIELNKKLAYLSKRVVSLEKHYNGMLEKAVQLESLAEVVQKHADKEKEMTNLTDLLLTHGETSRNIAKYVFGCLHAIRRKCVEDLCSMKNVVDMQSVSKTLQFKTFILKTLPDFGLAISDLPALLSILDFFTQSKILVSETGIFIKSQATSELPPLDNLNSDKEIAESGQEVRELLKFITSNKIDKKTRSSLRRFIAVGQCSRTTRPMKEFPDLFLVKEILGLR